MAARKDGTVTMNRRARRDYEILETMVAGIVLTGAEIKSIRDGRVNISQAYAQERDGEIWLINAHISEYHGAGGFSEHDPLRPKKLLLQRRQIRHLAAKITEQRIAVVPLKLFITRHLAKLELGVGRGRRSYDKRAVVAERDADRDMRRSMKITERR